MSYLTLTLLGTTEAVYESSVALGGQGGLCFGISVILRGLFFANTMRRNEFTTLIAVRSSMPSKMRRQLRQCFIHLGRSAAS